LQASTLGGTSNEVFTRAGMPAGTYYLRVWGFNGVFSTSQCYNLDLWITGTPRLGLTTSEGQNTTESGSSKTVTSTNPLLYPNPVADLLTIDLTGMQTATSVLIYDNCFSSMCLSSVPALILCRCFR
jgi:hypothetical protein